MKVAFTGKGGVGKTTLASLFVQVLAKEGKEILAVDCDPDSNLGKALGFTEKIRPIAQMEDVINERMGVDKQNKSFFQLNPKIDDIPDKFSKSKGNIKLIVMGAVKKGGAGCMCPENAFVKNLLNHIVLKRDEHIVMDMEAGLEHFGRGTAASCDCVLIVVEPSLNSIETAKNIWKFARDIGISKAYALGNKIRQEQESAFIEQELGAIKLIEAVEFDQNFSLWDKENAPVASQKIALKLEKVKQLLEQELG